MLDTYLFPAITAATIEVPFGELAALAERSERVVELETKVDTLTYDLERQKSYTDYNAKRLESLETASRDQTANIKKMVAFFTNTEDYRPYTMISAMRLLTSGGKIEAIKYWRTAADENNFSIGLKESKEDIERLIHAHGFTALYPDTTNPGGTMVWNGEWQAAR